MDYEQLWDRRAPYFDIDYHEYDLDISFFRPYFETYPIVCELGCGTLRIPDALEDSFEKYYGIDVSSKMLARGHSRLSKRVSNKVETLHTGMQEFSLPEKADLVFNMGNSFLMLSEADKRLTLERVKNNLSSDGRFVLEIYNPNRWRDRPQNQMLHLRTVCDTTANSWVTLSYTQRIDEKRKINHIIWFREEINQTTRAISKDVFPIEFDFLGYSAARELLEQHFRIIDQFGSFERTSLEPENCRRFIFVCQPR